MSPTDLFFQIFLWEPQSQTATFFSLRPLPEREEGKKEGREGGRKEGKEGGREEGRKEERKIKNRKFSLQVSNVY